MNFMDMYVCVRVFIYVSLVNERGNDVYVRAITRGSLGQSRHGKHRSRHEQIMRSANYRQGDAKTQQAVKSGKPGLDSLPRVWQPSGSLKDPYLRWDWTWFSVAEADTRVRDALESHQVCCLTGCQYFSMLTHRAQKERGRHDLCANCGVAATTLQATAASAIATATEPKLKKCGGCSTVRYCSSECQKQHWKVHKKDCERMRIFREQHPVDQPYLVTGDGICTAPPAGPDESKVVVCIVSSLLPKPARIKILREAPVRDVAEYFLKRCASSGITVDSNKQVVVRYAQEVLDPDRAIQSLGLSDEAELHCSLA